MKCVKKTFLALFGCLTLTVAFAGPVDDDITRLQRSWEEIKYLSDSRAQEKQFERLTAEANQVLARYPDRAEVLIWHGIIEASYAGAKGGLGALSLVKDARRDFEEAIQINPQALAGSAYTSLGSLYYQVPGWPLGFGDDRKAQEYLQQGLAINPHGIDPNFFYGEFMFRSGNLDTAEQFLRKALEASPRPGRKLADDGRRKEINALLEKIAERRR